MILSDRDIKKRLGEGTLGLTSPRGDLSDQIHHSSVDIRLGSVFKLYDHSKYAILDPRNMESFSDLACTVEVPEGEPFIIQPGEFVLGVTEETIALPADVVARVEGRSSLGRLGIIVHATAGYIDPGFEGTITLEISNINRMPVALYPGMRICQYAFHLLSSPAEELYHEKSSSKYYRQQLPEESRITNDPEFLS